MRVWWASQAHGTTPRVGALDDICLAHLCVRILCHDVCINSAIPNLLQGPQIRYCVRWLHEVSVRMRFSVCFSGAASRTVFSFRLLWGIIHLAPPCVNCSTASLHALARLGVSKCATVLLSSCWWVDCSRIHHYIKCALSCMML